MSTNDPITDPNHVPLRDVAQNPDASARYLNDVQRVLLEVGRNLETLQVETRLHCRGTHVQGDRRYHARLRSLPVERSLRDVLKSLDRATEGLEKTTRRRRVHEDQVRALPGIRMAKALAKQQKKSPMVLQPAPAAASHNSQQSQRDNANSGYSGIASVYDIRKDQSA